MTSFSELQKSLLERERAAGDNSLDLECGAWALSMREARGLSMQAMGRLVGISAAYVNQLEKGRKPWNSDLLRRFKEAL